MTAQAAASAPPSPRLVVWRLLEGADDTKKAALVRAALLALILLNVASLIAESHLQAGDPLLAVLSVFEATSCGVFSLEYALRLWASVEDPRYSHPLWGRLRFATRPVVVLDLLAIAPALLALGSVDTRFLRLARLSRLLRVLKLGRYSRALRELAEVIRSRTPDLVSALFVMLLLLLSAAIAVFFAEHDAQPEVFSNVTASLWWAIVTMTTVGYGDVFPITTLGRVLAAAISILGIGLFALPAGIIADGYRERLGERRRSAQPCRHCGHVPSEDER